MKKENNAEQAQSASKLNEKHKKEYDAFGPWIWEIDSNDEVPDIFLKYFSMTDDVEMAFKIPRHIERRNAHPGMDLYDFLIVIYPDKASIFERIKAEVVERTIDCRQIIGLAKVTELLHGEFIFHLKTESVTVCFNTVSEDIIDRAVRLIRSHNAAAPAKHAENLPIPEMSILYKNLFRSENLKEPAAFLAHQREIKAEKEEKNFIQAFWFRMVRQKLQESMFLSTGKELIVVNSVPPLLRFRRHSYGYMRTYFPLSSITKTALLDHKEYVNIKVLTLSTETREFRFNVGSGFSDDVAAHIE